MKKGRFIVNVLIVWCLTGIWHGASINFLIWGLYYGVLLILEKFYFNKILDKIPNALKHFYALIIIIVGWIIFRSTSFNEITSILSSMIGLNGAGNLNMFVFTGIIKIQYIIIFIIGILAVTPLFNNIKERLYKTNIGFYVSDISLILVFILSICFIVIGTYSPFIYFRF